MASDPFSADVPQSTDAILRRLSRSLTTPWWYKALSGLLMALGFVGIGMTFDNAPFRFDPTQGALIVTLLAATDAGIMLWALRRSTGASFDRYGPGSGTGALSLVLIGLLLGCIGGQHWGGWSWGMLAGAVAAFLLTVGWEARLDEKFRRGRVTASPTHQG